MSHLTLVTVGSFKIRFNIHTDMLSMIRRYILLQIILCNFGSSVIHKWFSHSMPIFARLFSSNLLFFVDLSHCCTRKGKAVVSNMLDATLLASTIMSLSNPFKPLISPMDRENCKICWCYWPGENFLWENPLSYISKNTARINQSLSWECS